MTLSVKSNGERVHKVAVGRTRDSPPTEPSAPERVPYGRLTRDAGVARADLEAGECILSDVVDGDTCSVDLLLDDDGCAAHPAAVYGNLRHRSHVEPPQVSI